MDWSIIAAIGVTTWAMLILVANERKAIESAKEAAAAVTAAAKATAAEAKQGAAVAGKA
jgi:hypothetical protein